MRPAFLMGAVGQGLNSFMDSYLQAKDLTRRQAQADDEMAMRKRQQEREDFTSGVKWDPETKTYSENHTEGLLTKSEERRLSRLIEMRKAEGEDWASPENATSRALYQKLIQKSLGADVDRGANQAPATTVGGLSIPASKTPPVASAASGLVAPMAKKYNVPPLLARDEQIAQTEALGQIPSVPTGSDTQQQSPYAKIKKQIMSDAPWRKASKEKLFQIAMKEAEQGNQKLPAGDALKLSEAALFPKVFDKLEKSIDENKELMGPFHGLITGNNPYNTKAQIFQSEISADAQLVGKYLESGVLRKEDVPKYEKMLPKMTDTPEVAKAKLKNVRALIESKIETDRQGLKGAGYNVGAQPPKTLYQPGQTIYIDGVPHRVGADGKTADPL